MEADVNCAVCGDRVDNYRIDHEGRCEECSDTHSFCQQVWRYDGGEYDCGAFLEGDWSYCPHCGLDYKGEPAPHPKNTCVMIIGTLDSV